MTRRPAWLGAAAGVLILACLLPTAPAGASPPPGGRFSGDLTGVSCVSASDCWAVGGTGNNVAISDHWDGSAWSVVHVPAPPGAGSTELPGISCTGAATCWAVGDYESVKTSKLLPYAEHWTGAAWSVVPMPGVAGSFNTTMASVACTGAANCWAAGAAGSPAGPLLERWNGHTWARQHAPAIGARSTLQQVYCARASDCWITGSDGRNGTLAAHWDGSAWSVTPTPTAGKGEGELLSILCAGRDCMAVGDNAAHMLAERWDGSAWTVTATGHTLGFLAGVSCTAGFRCLATGNTLAGRVFSEVWTGSAWHTVAPAVPPRSQADGLVGVSCVAAADCWSVGNWFNGAEGFSLIEHWNGSAWSVVP